MAKGQPLMKHFGLLKSMLFIVAVLALIFVFVNVLMLLFWIVATKIGVTNSKNALGINEIGDSFGSINAFLSGAGLVFIAYSLYQQNKISRDSKEGLEISRADSKSQKRALEHAVYEARESIGANVRLLRLQEFSMRMSWLQVSANINSQITSLEQDQAFLRKRIELVQADSTTDTVDEDLTQSAQSFHSQYISLLCYRKTANRFIFSDPTMQPQLSQTQRLSEDCIVFAAALFDCWLEHTPCSGRVPTLNRQNDKVATSEAECEVRIFYGDLRTKLIQKWQDDSSATQLLSRLPDWTEEISFDELLNCDRILLALYALCQATNHKVAMSISVF